MRKSFAVLAVIALFAIPMLAQDHPKADIFGGYQFTRINPGHGESGENFNGWNAAVTGWVNQYLGITADFSGAYKTIDTVALRQYTFLFGPTIASHANEKFTPFAHALFGGAHCTTDSGPCFGAGASNTAFAMAFGGGLDINAGHNVGVRIGQFDYLMTKFASDRQNDFRYSAGIVFHF